MTTWLEITMYSSCSIHSTGKWILTGEHAVLRGNSAIVFPLHNKRLSIDYNANNKPVSVTFNNNPNHALIDSFRQGMLFALAQLQLTKIDLSGHFTIHNQIPIGQGMGASAALSVAIARWFVAQGRLSQTEITPFATNIEHLYHGTSSGLDIAGVQANRGLIFTNGATRPLNMHWQPYWALSFCGKASRTADCITKVQAIQKNAHTEARNIDKQMQHSASMAETALSMPNKQGRDALVESMHLGLDCFRRWGLISPEMKAHLSHLKTQGALAAKPTGSGAGGYAISLWPQRLSQDQGSLPIDTATLCYGET